MAGFNMMDLLNKQSTVEQPALRVVKVPLASIVPNARNCFPIQELELLAADIAANGLRQPLFLYDLRHAGEPGKYMLIDGERRYRAHLLNKAEVAECIISRAETEEQARMELLLQELTHRRATQASTMQGMVELKKCLEDQRAAGAEISGRIRDLVAQYFNVSPAQVGRAEKIDANLSPELKDAFQAGQIKSTEAYALAGQTPERQAEAARQIRETGKVGKPEKVRTRGEVLRESDAALARFLYKSAALTSGVLYCKERESCMRILEDGGNIPDEECVQCLIDWLGMPEEGQP